MNSEAAGALLLLLLLLLAVFFFFCAGEAEDKDGSDSEPSLPKRDFPTRTAWCWAHIFLPVVDPFVLVSLHFPLLEEASDEVVVVMAVDHQIMEIKQQYPKIQWLFIQPQVAVEEQVEIQEYQAMVRMVLVVEVQQKTVPMAREHQGMMEVLVVGIISVAAAVVWVLGVEMQTIREGERVGMV